MMEKKEKEVEKTLERIREMQLEIDEMCEQMSTLRERATSISQALSDMPKAKGSSTSKIENAVLEIRLKGQQMEVKVNTYLLICELIERDIMTLLKDRRKQTVLKSRYIYNYSWKRIAQLMKLSVSQVHKHKHIALDVLEKVLENDTK